MSVSIFSYDGRITIGLLVHSALVADPQAILGRIGREVAALGIAGRWVGSKAGAIALTASAAHGAPSRLRHSARRRPSSAHTTGLVADRVRLGKRRTGDAH